MRLDKVPDSSWEAARPIIRRNFQRIDSLVYGLNSNVTFNSVTVDTLSTSAINATSVNISDLTASRLVATNADKDLVSVADLASWIYGTNNQVTVTNSGNGKVTLSTPQDTHAAASPQFTRLGLGVAASASLLIHARETSKPVRVSSSAALTAGQYTGFEVQNTGIYTWGIGIDYDQGTTSLVFKTGGMSTAGYAYKMTGNQFTNQGASPTWNILNTNNENTQDGCISVFNFKDHTDVVLSSISGAHDGIADDTKGVFILKTHNGTTLTETLRINSSQNATFAGTLTWSGGGSANANTAYGWGNHASAGYFIKASDDLDDISAGVTNVHLTSTLKTNYDTAYTHSQIAGGDSVHVSVTENSNWDAAYAHKSNNGSDHSYLNQSVVTSASPYLVGLGLGNAATTPDGGYIHSRNTGALQYFAKTDHMDTGTANNRITFAFNFKDSGGTLRDGGFQQFVLEAANGVNDNDTAIKWATHKGASNNVNMLLNHEGYLGIGTDIVPVAKLHVMGTDYISSIAHDDYDVVLIENNSHCILNICCPTGSIGGIKFSDSVSGRGYIRYNHGDDSMQLYAADTQAITIDSNADVDILNDLTAGTIQADNGATGSFTTVDLKTVTVVKGIITSIV